MPFTLFHFGPALFFGVPLRKYIHAPTFILANVVLDVEPLLVLITRANYPLHGYLHTIIAAIGVGLLLGFTMFLLERRTQSLFKAMLLETHKTMGKSSFMVAGVFGTLLHVLFDAPLYGDIKPFYPLATNSLPGLASSSGIYILIVGMGILGIMFYASLLVSETYRRAKAKPYESRSSSMLATSAWSRRKCTHADSPGSGESGSAFFEINQ
jgi:hypothetical protein